MDTKKKPRWAVDKHAAALGTEFAKCAACPGTTGKVANGTMGCSRVGAGVVWLAPAQVQRCDGKKPIFLEDAWPVKTATSTIGQLSAA